MTYDGLYKRTGTFKPKIMETLRPCMLPLVGKIFEWDFAGFADNDETQTAWTFDRKHDQELNGAKYFWIPAEDIEFAMTGSELRAIRLALGLTQREFGHALGLTQNDNVYAVMSRLECGNVNISLTTARLAKSFEKYGVPERFD